MLEAHGYTEDNRRYLADCAQATRAAQETKEDREKFLGKPVMVIAERFGGMIVGICSDVRNIHGSVSYIVDGHVCWPWEVQLA